MNTQRHTQSPSTLKHQLAACIMVLVTLANPLFAQASDWDDSLAQSFKQIEIHKDLRIKGFALTDKVYWGQAKIAGKSGLGFVVTHKTFAWGVNQRGVSFVKRF